MQLSSGDKLGPYEVVGQIGAGGMGTVYRARDPRIGREVAIKISAEHFSDRFEREARAVAALNHPNICTLHDVGPNYLVMELVDGESPHGPLPLQTALEYARQVADALDAAHDKGIIHRDLKPANIKVRTDGTVKVLDFGLAKIGNDVSSADDPSNSPTMRLERTQVGTILGTAAYMAPEQARGKPVDKRADIWAFGAVLYEMLTGRRAFDGEDTSMILAAVLNSEPRWDGVPARVRCLLESCLQKDPRKRLRDIGDVWELLDDEPKPVATSRTGSLGWSAAAALAVLAAIAFWAPWRKVPKEAPQPVVKLDVDLGPDVSLVPLLVPTFNSVIISPDGTRIVVVGSVAGGPPRLFSRRLNQFDLTEIAGTQGAGNPFFSADGKWVAFWDGKGVAKVSLDGGAVVRLGEANVMTGGSWGEDGNLVVGTGSPNPDGLLRIDSSGGGASPLAKLANRELFQLLPQLLPGGKTVLITSVGSPPSIENSTIDVVSIADGKRKTLVRGGFGARYLPSGHLLYANRATMFAVPFDIDRQEIRGTAVPILDDVAFDAIANVPQYDVSSNGTLVYRKNRGAASTLTNVQWLDAAGKQEPILSKPNLYAGPLRLSPDGRRAAITIRDGADEDVWVYEVQRDAMTRLTFGGGRFTTPVWSRDGQYIVFQSMGNGLFWTRADGAGQPQRLLPANTLQLPASFRPDGKRLAFVQIDGLPQLWSVEISQDAGGLKAGKSSRFLNTRFTDSDAAFSPDGRWLAYQSNESGRPEVYVRPFSPTSGQDNTKVPISNNGGIAPIWSPNGRELLYQAGGQIMSVSYAATGDSFVADKPRVWIASVGDVFSFDLAPDGKRIAVIQAASGRAAPKEDHSIVFVQNFFDELRRRVPVSP